MKMKYELEFIQIDDEWNAVPLDNENGESFHGILKINDTAKEMLECIQKFDNPNDAFSEFLRLHPEAEPNEMGPDFANILNQLIREGLLLDD